jgi:hypothetical protein
MGFGAGFEVGMDLAFSLLFALQMSLAYLLMLIMMMVDYGLWFSTLAGLSLGASRVSVLRHQRAKLLAQCNLFLSEIGAVSHLIIVDLAVFDWIEKVARSSTEAVGQSPTTFLLNPTFFANTKWVHAQAHVLSAGNFFILRSKRMDKQRTLTGSRVPLLNQIDDDDIKMAGSPCCGEEV